MTPSHFVSWLPHLHHTTFFHGHLVWRNPVLTWQVSEITSTSALEPRTQSCTRKPCKTSLKVLWGTVWSPTFCRSACVQPYLSIYLSIHLFHSVRPWIPQPPPPSWIMPCHPRLHASVSFINSNPLNSDEYIWYDMTPHDHLADWSYLDFISSLVRWKTDITPTFLWMGTDILFTLISASYWEVRTDITRCAW